MNCISNVTFPPNDIILDIWVSLHPVSVSPPSVQHNYCREVGSALKFFRPEMYPSFKVSSFLDDGIYGCYFLHLTFLNYVELYKYAIAKMFLKHLTYPGFIATAQHWKEFLWLNWKRSRRYKYQSKIMGVKPREHIYWWKCRTVFQVALEKSICLNDCVILKGCVVKFPFWWLHVTTSTYDKQQRSSLPQERQKPLDT